MNQRVGSDVTTFLKKKKISVGNQETQIWVCVCVGGVKCAQRDATEVGGGWNSDGEVFEIKHGG